ncbi:type II toxin-antitoxin system YafQ family toxin [bacterium]|nr:type II toxin-antitoxin system YafQ family toxin [bacterium]
MYSIVYTNRMKRDAKLMQKRGKDMSKLVHILNLLSTGVQLPDENRDHQLTGNLKDFRECHIESDWLLMYRIIEDKLILSATATGTHSDLFGK